VATPQATPKHLTDEELRQQYGIQLASRPQEDVDGKEAKWADIDDDEDDWAPETIEWNDGTKITLPQTDHTAVLAEEQAAAAAKEKQAEAAKSKPPIIKSTTVGPNATVLKLGAATQPKSGGLVLKGVSEKPTLVAKPPSSNQVKSPWASLPPVDKVPPVSINPLNQPSAPRFGQPDLHGFDAMPPRPVHAKEIAADDFSRSSREAANGVPKELFNSQSGRYEPVNETRRGSTIRKEQNYRAPSLLQRPAHNDSSGPAEPSPAFQTSRSGQQEPTQWIRRRTSSNVSGDSGNLGRRTSIGKGFEIPRLVNDVNQPRRGSHYEQSPLNSTLHGTKQGFRDASPVQSHDQSVTSQSPSVAVSQTLSMNNSAVASPQQTHAVPVAPSIPVPAAVETQQDIIAAQKRLMKEKADAAIKRKKEEEAKEEAERKERIRLHMEKIGLVDDKKGKKETAEDLLALAATPKVAQTKEEVERKERIRPRAEKTGLGDDKKGRKETAEETPALSVAPDKFQATQSATPRSPPKPPVPNVSGPPQQYGLMKVHASHPVNATPLTNGLGEPKPSESTPLKAPATSDNEPFPTVGPSTNASELPQASSHLNQPLNEVHILHTSENLQDMATDTKSQPWKGTVQQGPNGYSTWNSTSGMTTHSASGANLWGPPSNHRALGNGDFNTNVQRSQSRQPPVQSHTLSPSPIGTPAPYPGPETTAMPPNVQQKIQPQPESKPRVSDTAAWHNFALATQIEDAKTAHDGYVRNKAEIADLERTGSSRKVDTPLFETAYTKRRKSPPGPRKEETAGIRTPKGVSQPPTLSEAPTSITPHLQHITQDSPDLPSEYRQLVQGTGAHDHLPAEGLYKSQTLPHGAPQVRSRYHELFDQKQRAVSAPVNWGRSRSMSPPPPEALGSLHPVYMAINERPVVNLPGSKLRTGLPRPTVRLPPNPAPASPSPASEAHPPTNKSVTKAEDITERIKGLFHNGKSSPEKKSADVQHFSISKVELPIDQQSASVTLPPRSETELTLGAAAPVVLLDRDVEEVDALFEDRGFGSLPLVHMPTVAPVNAWTPCGAPQSYRIRFTILTDREIMSVPAMLLGLNEAPRGNGFPITIRIGNMLAPKTKKMARVNAYGNPRPKSGNFNKPKPRNGPKSRDSSANQATSKPVPTNSRPSGQFVPNQQTRPAINNNTTTWARRVSGAVQH
jgi:hypothetical protein